MINSLKSFLKYGIIFGVTGYLLWHSIETIDKDALLPGESRLGFIYRVWQEGDKFYFFMSAVFTVLSHILRAERWKLLLNPIGYHVSLWNSFTAVMNGYFINLAIPRGGEVSRPVTLNKLEGVPVGTSIGTVVMERIIDLVFLVSCIGTVFVFQFHRFVEFFSALKDDGSTKESSDMKYYIIGGALLVGTAAIFYLYKKNYLHLVKEKVLALLDGLKSGFLSIFKLEKRFMFFLHSILIWVCYYLMLWMILLAFKETEALSYMDALTIFAIGGIALAMPLPGGAGSYHKLVPLAMVGLCGLADERKGVAFAFIFHGWQTLIIIMLGMIGLIVINHKVKKTRANKG